MVMNALTKSVQYEAPRCKMFEDDVIVVHESVNVLDGKFERWREALKNKG